MFEQPVDREEKDRSRAIMLLSGAALIVVLALIILVSQFSSGKSAKNEMARAGSAEFDWYVSSVKIVDVEKYHGERLSSRYGKIVCRLQNEGDRALAGLQLRAAAVGFNNEPLREKIVTLVPSSLRNSLPAGQSAGAEIYIEPIPDPAEVMDMVVEVYALKLK
jgi:hypothetical protein